MADCCFPAERGSVDAGTTSQLARLHVVSLRPGKGAADLRRSSSSNAQPVGRTSAPARRSGSAPRLALGRRERSFAATPDESCEIASNAEHGGSRPNGECIAGRTAAPRARPARKGCTSDLSTDTQRLGAACLGRGKSASSLRCWPRR